MRKLVTATLLTLCIAGRAAAASADQIDIDVSTPADPAEAIGLVVSPDGIEQKLETSFRRQSDGVITVSVPLSRADHKQGTVVTAMVVAADGTVSFGNTKAAWIPEITASEFETAACPLPPGPRDVSNHGGDFEMLVENRSAQRSLLQLKVGNILQGEMLKKIQRLERGFGLEQGRPLDPKLPPLELQDRLARIEIAISNYKANKASIQPKQERQDQSEE